MRHIHNDDKVLTSFILGVIGIIISIIGMIGVILDGIIFLSLILLGLYLIYQMLSMLMASDRSTNRLFRYRIMKETTDEIVRYHIYKSFPFAVLKYKSDYNLVKIEEAVKRLKRYNVKREKQKSKKEWLNSKDLMIEQL